MSQQLETNQFVTGQIIQLTIPDMTGRRRPSSPAKYRDDLIARTEAARRVSGKSREEVIAELSARTGQKIQLATYKKWETRTPIPHFYIIPFCEVTGADVFMLLTGQPFRLGRNTPAAGHLQSPETSSRPKSVA